MPETTVFFRDDDMGGVLEPLRSVMQLLREQRVPCHYMAVPEHLQPEVVRLALAQKEAGPELVFLGQHGLRHRQEIRGQQCFSEFAGGRPFDDQFRDIETGSRILRNQLGEAFDSSSFTPPCHRYDANTVRALSELGYSLLSAGVRADRASLLYYRIGSRLGKVTFLGKRVSYHLQQLPGTNLFEVSATIDVDFDHDPSGRPCLKSVDYLWHEFELCRTRLPVVGIMLHHACYDRPEKVDTLRAFVQRLRADPSVCLASMHDIARSRLAVRAATA